VRYYIQSAGTKALASPVEDAFILTAAQALYVELECPDPACTPRYICTYVQALYVSIYIHTLSINKLARYEVNKHATSVTPFSPGTHLTGCPGIKLQVLTFL